MFVVKVTHEETTRRLVLDEPYSFAKLCGLIVNRFELKPDEVSRASLRYTDPDGDLISVNTDVELQDALALLGNSEPPLLRMTLKLGEGAVVGNASWAHALEQASDDADSVVMVEDDDRAKEEERLKAEEEEEDKAKALAVAQEQREAEEALEVAAAEAEAAAEELRLAEAERKRGALEAKAQEEAKALAEVEARKAKEEEERLRREMEASQQRLEEEVQMIKEQEAERLRMLQLQAKRQADEEERERQARLVICLNQAEDNAIYRIGQLVEMGCSAEQLESIFSKRVICMYQREASASAESKKALEPALKPVVEPAAAKAVPQEETSPAAKAPEAAPVPEPVHVPAPELPAVPAPESDLPVAELPVAEPVAPIVAQDVTAQPLPVAEPVEALDVATRDLAARLGEFYMLHNPAGLDKVPQLIKDFGSRIETLNTLLRTKYGADLSSVAQEAQPEAPQPFEALMEDAEEPSAPPVEESEAMKELVGMGFSDRAINQALLEKHEGDMSKVINELLGA